MNVYLAGPLFTMAERCFNDEFAHLLESRDATLRVILPQEADAAAVCEPDHESIFRQCIEGIDRADVVAAILDGPDADSGTCVEIGYARAKGKPVIGIRTDFRECQDRGLNIMVSQACSRLIRRSSISKTIEELADEVVASLQAL